MTDPSPGSVPQTPTPGGEAGFPVWPRRTARQAGYRRRVFLGRARVRLMAAPPSRPCRPAEPSDSPPLNSQLGSLPPADRSDFSRDWLVCSDTKTDTLGVDCEAASETREQKINPASVATSLLGHWSDQQSADCGRGRTAVGLRSDCGRSNEWGDLSNRWSLE